MGMVPIYSVLIVPTDRQYYKKRFLFSHILEKLSFYIKNSMKDSKEKETETDRGQTKKRKIMSNV